MAPTQTRRRRKSIDAKWLAHIAIARRNGDPMAFSKKVETRNLRQLTARRKSILEKFMATFQANQEAYERYGSDAWINAVLKCLNEPRHVLLPLDIENWLATDIFFQKFNQIFQYRPDSATAYSNGEKTIEGQPPPAAEVAIDKDVEIIDLTMVTEGVLAATTDDDVEIIDQKRDEQAPTSKANPASIVQETVIPENIDLTEAAIPPLRSSVHLVNTTQKLHDYVNEMYNYIVELRNQGRADIRSVELESCYNVISTIKLLLNNNAGRS